MNFELIIVDDDPEYVFFHKLLTKKSGLSENPLCFYSGQDVINYLTSKAEKDSENILIFLDLYMTDVDGWMVLDFLKSLNQPDKIKTILITSSINRENKKKSIQYPNVLEYIEKPLTMNHLVNLKNQTIF